MKIYTGHVISILETMDSRVSSPSGAEKKMERDTQNFRVGDLVVIADKNLSRANWPLGRIIEMFPGSDNMIRVAKVSLCTTDERSLCTTD